jgi:hypothetical protein
VRDIYIHEIAEPADVLRLKVPLPLGRNLYQADKALKNNHLAVRDGGGIMLEADCPEGIGPNAFMRLLRWAGDHASAKRRVQEDGYTLGDHKAVKLRYLTDPTRRGVHVALISPNIADADAATAGLWVFRAEPAAAEWLARVVAGPLRRGLVVEDAGLVSVTACGA